MKISDSHTDFLTELTSKQAKKYLNEIKQAGVKIVSCAVFTTNKGFGLLQIKKFKKLLQENSNSIILLLSIEDCSFVKNLIELNKLIKLKPFSVGLTWNFANQYAGGALSRQGLTKLGKQAISLIEQNKTLVDTAHLNRHSFYQFAKITKLPIYNSHSNIYNLKRHKRNLTDKQISLIVKSGGYLGLTLYKNFVTNKKFFAKQMALQFDYLIKKFGYKNFGLGTDFFGVEENYLPLDIKNYSQLKSLALELKKLGHSKQVIDCLFYKNFKDFLKRISILQSKKL